MHTVAHGATFRLDRVSGENFLLVATGNKFEVFTMSKDAKKERAWPQFETAEAEQIRAWATANGYGSRSFNEQVRLAALYASRDFIVAAETANAR